MDAIDKKLLGYIIGVYLLVIIPYSTQFIKNTTCTIKGSESWKWNNENYKQIAYFVYIITIYIFLLVKKMLY